jgi:hypothetical protein
MQGVAILCVVILNVTMQVVIIFECNNCESCHAECFDPKCCYAKCHYAKRQYAKCSVTYILCFSIPIVLCTKSNQRLLSLLSLSGQVKLSKWLLEITIIVGLITLQK